MFAKFDTECEFRKITSQKVKHLLTVSLLSSEVLQDVNYFPTSFDGWLANVFVQVDTVIFQSKGSYPKPRHKYISPLTYPEKGVTAESWAKQWHL